MHKALDSDQCAYSGSDNHSGGILCNPRDGHTAHCNQDQQQNDHCRTDKAKILPYDSKDKVRLGFRKKITIFDGCDIRIVKSLSPTLSGSDRYDGV